MSGQSIMDFVLKFEDDIRDAVREQERNYLMAVAELQNELVGQRAEARAKAKTATDFLQKNEALRAENAKLRERITSLERDTVFGWEAVREVRAKLAQLQEEYANRGVIIQDLAKREHEHQKLIAELEKQIGYMEKILKEFFPAPIIPDPWEPGPGPMAIPQGEWVLRSNEALRNRVVELEKQIGRMAQVINGFYQGVA